MAAGGSGAGLAAALVFAAVAAGRCVRPRPRPRSDTDRGVSAATARRGGGRAGRTLPGTDTPPPPRSWAARRSTLMGGSGELSRARVVKHGGWWALAEAGAVYVALRLLLLPGLAYGIGAALGLDWDMRTGLALIAASPASPLSNFWQWLSLTPTAFGMVLTAVGTLLCLGSYTLVLRLYIPAPYSELLVIPYTSIGILAACYIVPLAVCTAASAAWGKSDAPPAAAEATDGDAEGAADAVLTVEVELCETPHHLHTPTGPHALPAPPPAEAAGEKKKGGGAEAEARPINHNCRILLILLLITATCSIYFVLGKLGYVPQDQYADILKDHSVNDWMAVLIFVLSSFCLGYGVPRVLGLSRPVCRLMSMECGYQNEWLALLVLKLDPGTPFLLDKFGFAITAYAVMQIAVVPLCTLLNRYLYQTEQVQEYIEENQFRNSFKEPSAFMETIEAKDLEEGQLSVQTRHNNAINRIFGERRETRYPASHRQVEDHLRSLKQLKEEQERIKAERESQVLSYM